MKWKNPFVQQDLIQRPAFEALYQARLKMIDDILFEIAGKPFRGDGSGDGKGSGRGSGEVCNHGLGTSLDHDYYCAPRGVARMR